MQEKKQLKKEKESTTLLGQNPFLQGLKNLLKTTDEETVEMSEILSGGLTEGELPPQDSREQIG